MWRQRFLKFSAVVGITAGTVAALKVNEWDAGAVGLVRFGRAAVVVAKIVLDYKKTLYSGKIDPQSPEFSVQKSNVHRRSAERLLELCCINRGAFIKVGQHIGALDYLLPSEYVETMRILHSRAPQSPVEDLYQVIREDLKQEPSEIFSYFDPEPLGAASLAQVHLAKLKDETPVAIKVQHPYVRDHAQVDMKSMEILVHIVAWLFPEFQFMWLAEETKKNLPVELNFYKEGQNAEKVEKMFTHFSWLKVPHIYWDMSTERVLTMEYCEGGQVNDLAYMQKNNISTYEVTDKLGQLYSEMIFVRGFVHCDPHPGNVLVQKTQAGVQIVLLDHGLYTNLTNDFRWRYSKLWTSILNSDLQGIQQHSSQLGVGDLYGLLSCMVTGRSWSSVSSGIDKHAISPSEQAEIKKDAAIHLTSITNILNRVPRQMLLIFKTNDLLRGIEYSLNTQGRMGSFISMSRCCIRSTYGERRQDCSSYFCTFQIALQEKWAQFRITLYQLYLWLWWFKLGHYIKRYLQYS